VVITLPCQCGRSVPVVDGAAGAPATCQCGLTVATSSLDGQPPGLSDGPRLIGPEAVAVGPGAQSCADGGSVGPTTGGDSLAVPCPTCQRTDCNRPSIEAEAARAARGRWSELGELLIFSLVLAVAAPLMYWGLEYAMETYSKHPWSPDGLTVRVSGKRFSSYERDATWLDTMNVKVPSGFFILLFTLLGVLCVIGLMWFCVSACRMLALQVRNALWPTAMPLACGGAGLAGRCSRPNGPDVFHGVVDFAAPPASESGR